MLNLNAGRPSLGAFSDGAGAQNVGSSSIADQTYMTLEDDDENAFPIARATPPRGGAAGRGRPAAGARGGSATARAGQPLKSALKKSASGSVGAAAAGPSAGAGAAKKISPALKKKREDYAHTIIATLPLEWRGSDQKLQKIAETVITTLMANPSKGQRCEWMTRSAKLSRNTSRQ